MIKNIVIKDNKPIMVMGAMSGPILRPFKVDENLLFKLINMGHLVYEVDVEKKLEVKLTLQNYMKDNFTVEVEKVEEVTQTTVEQQVQSTVENPTTVEDSVDAVTEVKNETPVTEDVVTVEEQVEDETSVEEPASEDIQDDSTQDNRQQKNNYYNNKDKYRKK